MKLAIMQPYLFPYIGYFQLINAVDTFIIYDDVNYIKQGWINRNNILLDQNKHLITLQLKGASSFKKINEVEVGNNKGKFLKTVISAYHKAPYFGVVAPVIENIMNYEENNLAMFIANSLKQLADYLELDTCFLLSSNITKNNDLKGKEKVINICNALGATQYINAIGGTELYDKSEFKKNNIELSFLKTKDIKYLQFSGDFISNLSIIDVLMFNSKESVKKMLNMYELR